MSRPSLAAPARAVRLTVRLAVDIWTTIERPAILEVRIAEQTGTLAAHRRGQVGR